MKVSLLRRDLRKNTEKIKDNVDELYQLNDSSPNQNTLRTQTNRNDLSKSGFSNTLMGSKAVLNPKTNFFKDQSNKSQNNNQITKNKQIKEHTMVIPIKSIILEFTADHIRDNAGKYAAGTMLGLGAAAGYLAGDPEHGSSLLNHDNSGDNNHQNTNINHKDTRSDFQKDLAGASQTKTIEAHNQNRGIMGNAQNSLHHFTNNLRAENKFNDLADAQDEYNNIKNSNGRLLSYGQMAGLGGVGLAGVGAMGLSKFKRR